jgi:hypothetical protein
MQALPGMQSLSVWQGHAHLSAATLHRWVRQWASVVQGRASGLGVDSGAADEAAEVACTGAAIGPAAGAGAGA